MKVRVRVVAVSCASVLVTALGACGDPPQTLTSDYLYPPGPRDDAGGYGDPSSSPDGGFGGFDGGPSGPQPDFGATVTQTIPPPPISGGSLLIARDGTTAIVADPDRDAVYIVDLASRALRATIALPQGAEPGRIVEDGARRAHVATRHGGELVTIDLASATIVTRRAVCSAPRGVAFEAATDSVHVACAGGDLVTFPASGGVATRTLHLESDLRDVVVAGGALYVTRFRTAEVLTIVNGVTVSHMAPSVSGSVPGVAWRAVASPSGGVAVVHQLSREGAVVPSPGGYGGGQGCSPSIVTTAISVWRAGESSPSTISVPFATLPVDVAFSANGAYVAIAAAGNGFTPHLGGVVVMDVAGGTVVDGGADGAGPPPPPPPPPPPSDGGVDCALPRFVTGPSQATSVAFDGAGRLIALQREPAALLVIDPAFSSQGPPIATIALSSVSRADTGHDVFHSQAGAFIACASCHAEGGDDARTWTFVGLGPRRTPSLRGTIAGTAPFHWDGAMRDFATLEHEVFEGRMSGPPLRGDKVAALASWVAAIPAPPQMTAVDAASAARGKAIFEGSAACATCHSGEKRTNNATVDVGTGGMLQVPPLVGLAWRAPFLHSGCAATLEERFSKCATPKHGSTAQLTTGETADLIAYLSTL